MPPLGSFVTVIYVISSDRGVCAYNQIVEREIPSFALSRKTPGFLARQLETDSWRIRRASRNDMDQGAFRLPGH